MTDANEIVVLMTAGNEAEAAMIIARLDADNIKASTVGGLTSGFRAEAPGSIQIPVHKADLERAKQALQQSL